MRFDVRIGVARVVAVCHCDSVIADRGCAPGASTAAHATIERRVSAHRPSRLRPRRHRRAVVGIVRRGMDASPSSSISMTFSGFGTVPPLRRSFRDLQPDDFEA